MCRRVTAPLGAAASLALVGCATEVADATDTYGGGPAREPADRGLALPGPSGR